MIVLVSGAIAFFVLHRVVSAGPLRAPLVKRCGEPVFLRLFGLASLLCLIWLTIGYWLASGDAPPLRWTSPPQGWVMWALQFVSVFLITSGALVRNPGTAGMTDSVSEPDIARGILRVTRHPFLWGVGIMAITHILTRPDDPTLIYFGTLAILALTGTVSIDRKRRLRLGDAWIAFEQKTSNIPFAAILTARQTLRPREIGLTPFGVSVGLFLVVAVLHWLLSPLVA